MRWCTLASRLSLSSRTTRSACLRSLMSIDSTKMPSGTGCARTSNQPAEPSAKVNSVSSCSATLSSMQRRSSANTGVASMPGHTSGMRWPRSSLLGRRFCLAAASLR